MPYVQTPEVNLYYEVHGEGYPVFFVHGGGGNTIAWFQQVPFFSRDYKAITVDLRGFKNSVCPPELVHPTKMAGDLLAIMDAEGLPEAAFVLQSMGAWAALPIAIRQPERVSCVFINGSPTPVYSEQNWNDVIKRADGIFKHVFGRGSGVGWNRKTCEEDPELVFLYNQIKALNPPFNASTMLDESNKIFQDEMRGYAIPTVVAGGAHDDFLNPECHIHTATLIPGAETYTFQDAGHSAYFETPAEFNEVVARFLKQHVPSNG